MVHARHFSGGLFSSVIGLILLIQATDPLAKYYFAIFYIFIGLLLILNSLRY